MLPKQKAGKSVQHEPTSVYCVLRAPFFVAVNAVTVKCEGCKFEMPLLPEVKKRKEKQTFCCDECVEQFFPKEYVAHALSLAIERDLTPLLSGEKSNIRIPDFAELVKRYRLAQPGRVLFFEEHSSALHVAFRCRPTPQVEPLVCAFVRALIEQKADVDNRVRRRFCILGWILLLICLLADSETRDAPSHCCAPRPREGRQALVRGQGERTREERQWCVLCCHLAIPLMPSTCFRLGLTPLHLAAGLADVPRFLR